MKPRERMIAVLNFKEPDRVPKGENHVDGNLVEEFIGHSTLYTKQPTR